MKQKKPIIISAFLILVAFLLVYKTATEEKKHGLSASTGMQAPQAQPVPTPEPIDAVSTPAGPRLHTTRLTAQPPAVVAPNPGLMTANTTPAAPIMDHDLPARQTASSPAGNRPPGHIFFGAWAVIMATILFSCILTWHKMIKRPVQLSG